MSSSDFTLNILAALNKQLSKRQLKSDLKGMDNSMYVKVIAKLATTLSKSQLKKDLKQLNDLYVQIGTKVNVDKNTKKQLQNRIQELQKSLSELEVNLKVSKAKAVGEVDSARKEVQAKASKVPVGFDIEVKRSKAIADIEYLGKRFSKLFSNVAAKQKYENILGSAYSISDETQLRSVRNQIAAFTSELKANGLASQSLVDKWRSLIERSKNLFSAASIVTAVFTQVRQAVSTFLQLDTAMTNLYKVTNDITSRDQFSGLLTKWNKLAQNLAVTTESLINSAAEWSKIGFNLDMSEQLAQITAIFEKTAEISTEKATSTLISAAQAFTEIGDLGEDDYIARVEAIGDRINAIGNKYSISSEGISDGLQNASAALKVAGNDLDETIALITAANKIFQSPSEVSNMLKVASMRLRGQVDALEEMGEDATGVSADITKIQQQIYELTGNKVNIFEDEDTLKSTYQMILEIGEVFDSLNDRSQADLLEVMFGKQRSSAGASLLLNYKELEKIKNDSMNAANSMAEEYSKYMESAEAHITIFKEKLVETYSAFVSGDLIKYTADVGSGILDLVNTTDLLKHSILAVLALNVGKGITSFGTAIAITTKQMNTLGSSLQQVKNLPTDEMLRTKPLIEVGEATKNLTEKNLKLLLSQKQLGEEDRILILGTQGLSREEARAKLEKMGLTTATNAQSAANLTEASTTNVLKGAMGSLKASIVGVGNSIKAAFLSNPIGFILTGITTIISVASTVISNHNQKIDEARQKATELTEAYKQQQSSLDFQIKKYKELKESLDKGNLSTDEARSIKEQLLEIQNSLVDSYGTEASNIDLVNGKYREQLGLLSELTKEKAQSYITEHRKDFENAKKELEKIRTYKLGSIIPGIDDTKNGLVNYLNIYSDLLNVQRTAPGEISISIKANAEEADQLMHQLSKDLDDWANKNGVDHKIVEPLQLEISKYAGKTMTDKLKEYKSIYDEFMKAEIIRNDTLRPLYQQSIQAVEAYNKALSSGEGVTEAKTNLDSVQQSVQNVTGELDGSQKIFDDIYEGINKNAEAAYQLSQAFENDSTVQTYAEKLRGLYDTDLKAINLDNENIEKGEEAFKGLLETLGYTEPTTEQIQKVIDKLVELGYVIGETVIPDIPKEKQTLASTLTTHKDEIDDFQSKLKSLGDALSSIRSRNFEDSDLTDLLQKFPELADKTDDLENAIVKLINNALQTLYNTLGEDIPDGLKTSLQELADIASGTAKHLGDAFSSIHDSWDILHDFKDTMDKGFDSNVTDGLLQSVRKLSGELEILVAGYYSGVVTAEQLYEALKEHYGNDLRNYSEALIKKNGLNEDFYNAVGLASEKVTNQFMNDYDVDLKNCKNYNKAKLEIEQQTLGKIGSMWSKYYDAVSQTYTQEMLDLRKQEKSTPDNTFVLIDGEVKNKKQMLQEQIIEIESQVNNYKAAMESLNNIAYDGIRSNFEGIGSKLSANSSNSTKDFERTLDWIEQAIENVEKEVKELDDIVNSTYSTFSQKNEALAKEISKVSDEIELQQKAYEEYMRNADSIGLSDDYKSLVRDGAINIENISDENLQKKISDYQQWYDKAVDVSGAISDLNEQIKDLHVKGYELNSDRLEDLLKSESITEKQYLAEMDKLYKKYYENQIEYAQKAHEAKLALLEKEKSYLNSVANAASSLLDKEIEKIRDNAKAQEEPYKKQIEAYEAQIDLLNQKKKPLQDELKVLEDKAKGENLILDLQKKQYNLKKAENQSTKLLYKDGQLIWNNDPAAIRDARKDVDDAKLAIQKNDIQKQIDALDDEIDRYNDLIDLVNDQIDAINKAADNQIDALEKVKNKWQELIDQQEYAQNVLLLTGEFGANAITKILTGNDDDLLAQWKQNYINTLAGIDMESQGYIGDMTQQIASLYNVDLSPLQNQFQNVKESVDGVSVAADESLPVVTSYMDDIGTSAMNAASEVSSVAEAINSIPEQKDVTINVHTSGIGGSSGQSIAFAGDVDFAGRAFADGNKGLAHDEKNAIRSEYGQPELTVYPDGKTELTTQPVMSDLPKGTVIYNEEQTKKIMNAKTQSVGNAHADGTNDEGWITLSDGSRIRPLQPGDKGWDLMQKFQPLVDKMLRGETDIMTNAMIDHQKQMEQMVRDITTTNVVNNNRNVQPVVNQEFHITMPNVTNNTSAEALMRDLQSLSIKKYQVDWNK